LTSLVFAFVLCIHPAFAYLYGGIPTSSFSVCGVTFSPPWWYVASQGALLMLVDHSGNVLVNSDTVSSNSPPSGLSNALMVRYNGSDVLAITKSTAYVPGGITSNWSPGELHDSVVFKYGSSVIAAIAYNGGIYATATAVYQYSRAGCSSSQLCIDGSCVGKYVYVDKGYDCATVSTISGSTFVECSSIPSDGSRGTHAGCKYVLNGSTEYASVGKYIYKQASDNSGCTSAQTKYYKYKCVSSSHEDGTYYDWSYVGPECVGKYVYDNKGSSCNYNGYAKIWVCDSISPDGSNGTTSGCKYVKGDGTTHYDTQYIYVPTGGDCSDGVELQPYVCSQQTKDGFVHEVWLQYGNPICKKLFPGT